MRLVATLTLLIGMLGCSKSVDSDVKATRFSSEDDHFRVTIYNSVYGVAVNVFRQILTVNRTAPKESSQKIVQMLSNMMRHPETPVDPVSFFAVVKDAESAADLRWKTPNGRWFTTGNCTSGTCTGLFQVDVGIVRGRHMLPVWNNGATCQSSNLNIWQFEGGGDFCASLLWWIYSPYGNNGLFKCHLLRGTNNPFPLDQNPCLSENFTWTQSTFSNGYEAYGQAPQWGAGGWENMYVKYIDVAKAHHGVNTVAEVVAKFKADIGFNE